MIAAVRSGADAVYVGAKLFSARSGAHNFDDSELAECVRYCHQRGVKVHLALNTLLFEDEMDEALATAERAARADIDAVIVQDMGLAQLLRRVIPDLPLHASTQMSVHTPYGARALYEMGFERVVLSRELSLTEIKEIRDFCPEVELEVFVHGALCMCVSGQCYFSSMLGGRSANRGMCAQPCRLPMRFGGSDHALSLKDNGSLGYLRELQAIGVASAKIEGRMKRPEYVAAATAAAVQARDNGAIDREAEERLRSVFSRTGFTDGYLAGKIGEDMFGYRRKSDVLSADSRLLREIRTHYKDEAPRVGLRLRLCVKIGHKLQLTASDGTHTVQVTSSAPAERAEHVALTQERAAQSLGKTGNTPYYIEHLDAEIESGAAASAATLNALRRDALAGLDEKRAIRHSYTICPLKREDAPDPGAKKVGKRLCVPDLSLSKGIEDFELIFADLDGINDERLHELQQRDIEVGVEVPRATFGSEGEVYVRLQELRQAGVRHLLAHNIAAAYMGKRLGYTVHAGFGLNITNSDTLRWAAAYGVVDAELSPEIDLAHIEALRSPIPVGIIRYGYLPLMISRNAPAGKNRGCKNDDILQDRKDEMFPVRYRRGCVEIYNCVPILMPEKDYPMETNVFSIFRFSVEKSVENMEKILEKLRENRDFERKTHGLYLRGVKNFTIF